MAVDAAALAALIAACAACHGASGNATNPEVPSLAGQPRIFLENQLVTIRDGMRPMPAKKEVMAGVTDEAIVALAAHFAKLPVVPAAGPADPAKLKAGAEVSKRLLCGTCHLPDYAGQQQVPRLAGQNEAYLLQSMKQFRDGPLVGRDTIMAATLRGVSDAELASLAHHFARAR